MTYTPTRYGDVDLRLKADRAPGGKFDPVVSYVQRALNDLGYTPALKVDGLYGNKTRAAVAKFRAACKLPAGGMDQPFYDELDWRVYGELNGAWHPAPVWLTNVNPGGPAIVKGRNELTGEVVNTIGLAREGQRLSDVGEAFVGRALGYEGAVRRNQVGSSIPSRHWMGLAGDDMGDQNTDRIIDDHEKKLLASLRDYYFLRAQGFPAVAQNLVYELPGQAARTVKTAWRGRDRLCTLVLGNLQYGDGTLMFPGLTRNRDCSWTAVRNTYKALTTTHHVSPFHLHTDCLTGAPYGSPF